MAVELESNPSKGLVITAFTFQSVGFAALLSCTISFLGIVYVLSCLAVLVISQAKFIWPQWSESRGKSPTRCKAASQAHGNLNPGWRHTIHCWCHEAFKLKFLGAKHWGNASKSRIDSLCTCICHARAFPFVVLARCSYARWLPTNGTKVLA